MGVDKATLKVGDSMLIEFPLNILTGLFEKVMIVTNQDLIDDLKSSLASRNACLEIVKDIYPGHGALGGIYTALYYSKTPFIFVTACDMPFILRSFIQYMVESLPYSCDVLIPESSGGLETLHAIYKKNLAGIIRNNILNNHNKIKDFFHLSNVCYLKNEDVLRFDKEERMFQNINTPLDLEESRL